MRHCDCDDNIVFHMDQTKYTVKSVSRWNHDELNKYLSFGYVSGLTKMICNLKKYYKRLVPLFLSTGLSLTGLSALYILLYTVYMIIIVNSLTVTIDVIG